MQSRLSSPPIKSNFLSDILISYWLTPKNDPSLYYVPHLNPILLFHVIYKPFNTDMSLLQFLHSQQ